MFESSAARQAGFDLAELFEAYHCCRANKRRTANALAFELDYEANLVQLWHELGDGSYRPRRSVAFIIDKPVKREIFAADFRDRIVHHLIINKLNPLFEAEFIYDSYASRVGRGTLFGVARAQRFIRACSHNYTRDAYVLKLDIAGFFMHINVAILFAKLSRFIQAQYHAADRDLLIEVCRVVLFNDVRENCQIKGHRRDWEGLPANKSLFGSPPGCGLAIGNLTSQVFANFYLNDFDHYLKHELGVRFYGRYVDDLLIVDRDREYLQSLIPVLRGYLAERLGLTLHPRKIHLQHHTKGVSYLGTVIKPGRVYVGKRTKGNFHAAITTHNAVVADHHPDRAEQQEFQSSMNSYLGYMKQHDTRRLRRAMVAKHVTGWWPYAHVNGGVEKFVLHRHIGAPNNGGTGISS
ncbi:MAG: hypothetical protein HQ526_01515 [Actinobacteria bacterium]|nr:hypothetical protein [Actinomycetota bacterium]